MMGALHQMPTQTGLNAILAALAPPAPAGGEANGGVPGFEQLIASLPSLPGAEASAAKAAPRSGFEAIAGLTVEGPVIADAQPQAAAPAVALTQPTLPTATLPMQAAPLPAAPVADATTPAAAKAPVAEAAADDAATAASLLIAVATPRAKAAPAAGPVEAAPPVEAGDETDTDAARQVAPAPAIVAAPPAPETAAAAAPFVAAAPVAATREKPVAEKPTKAAAPLAVSPRTEGEARPAAGAATPKAAETAPPLPGFAAPPESKAAKPAIDAGAAMTVLFGQPATAGAAAVAPAAQPAPVAERTLDLGSDDRWIAQLAADIAATRSETGDLSFRLMPRHLGRLDVAMKMEGDGGVSLKFDTRHEATATIVTAAQPRLVEDLRQQGVRVTDAQVTHTPAEAGRQQQQGQGGRNAAPGASHLIETAAERPETHSNERAADRRGRFA